MGRPPRAFYDLSSIGRLQDARSRFLMKCRAGDAFAPQATAIKSGVAVHPPRLRDLVLPHGGRLCFADGELALHLDEPRQRKRPD